MMTARHLLGLLLVLGVLVGHHLAYNHPPPCGINNTSHNSALVEQRIIGGQQARPGEFPHQVLLVIMSEGKSTHCGGIILDSNYILTAAHCVDKKKPQDITVHVGSNKIYGGITYQVANIIIHSDYIQTPFTTPFLIVNDLALLETSKPIKFKLPTGSYGSVNRVCLPKGPINYRMGDEFIVTGWGRTNAEVDSKPIKLQKLKVPYLDGKECNAMYQKLPSSDYIIIDIKGQICTKGVKGKGDCYGDSGGPLVRLVDGAYELVGVVSGGSRCADESAPNFYARVDYYLDWIKEAMRQI